MQWKKHAIDSREENLNQVEARVGKLVASKKFKTKEDSDRRIKLEKNILQAVSRWERPTKPDLPKILEDKKKAEEDAAALIKEPLTLLVEKVTNRLKPKKENPKRPSLERRETIDTSRVFEHP